MSDPEIRYLGDVQRLTLKPGDFIVLSTPGRISVEIEQRIREQAETIFGREYKVIVMMDGLKIGVLSPEGETGT